MGKVTAKFAGACKGCGNRFAAGSRIVYESNTVLGCEACRDDLSEKDETGLAITEPVRVRVRLIRRRNEDGWTVMDCIPEGALPADAPNGLKFFSVVGVIEGEPGDVLDVVGSWVDHPRFGWQIKAAAAERAIASTVEGLVAFLKQLDQIGSVLAERIVRDLGRDGALAALDTSDFQALTRVQGVTLDRATQAIESYQSRKLLKSTWLYLCSLGLGENTIKRILEAWGSNARVVLNQDPYSLMALRGFGFVKADEVAMKMGMPTGDPRRCRAAVKHVMERVISDGHTWVEANMLVGYGNAWEPSVKAARETGLEPEQLEEGVKALLEEGWLVAEGSQIYDGLLHQSEIGLAGRLRALRDATAADLEVKPDHLEGLDVDQAEAIKSISVANVIVLTGGPGTGKSRTTKAIIKLFHDNRVRVACCAPTGKASRRLQEASEHRASTIHRLLEYQPHTAQFRYGPNEELPVDAVLVDEVSMADVRLMHDLLLAVRPGTRLVLIGDADQLPSIGPGAVLRDVIESGAIPVVRLTQIHRQASESTIPYLAKTVNEGNLPNTLDGPGVVYLPESQASTVRELVESAMDYLPERYGFEKTQIQILTPKHEGEIGGKTLNGVLQHKLNWGEGGVLVGAGGQARAGDPVIQTHNDYDIGVMNGEIGQTLFADPNGVDLTKSLETFESDLGAKIVMFKFGDGRQASPLVMSVGKPVLIVDFGDRVVGFSKAQARELLLSRAITVHRAQGSQFPCVVVPIADENAFMFSRCLLYTAITRAEKLLVLIGDRNVLEKSVNRIGDSTRRTSLRERLLESEHVS